VKNYINIGLFGLGTVGKGVVNQLNDNGSLIKKRLGREIRITRAVTANPDKERGIDLKNIQISNKINDIINDPEIDIVVELIGGIDLAKSIILQSLKKGKSVVTANKALLAECAEEIFNAAYTSKGLFGYEASVAGGIPIIRNIRESYSGDKIMEISGIINGTANYILSSMSEKNETFLSALKEAQEKGFAEADPTFDIEGIDAAHKLILLMNLSFNAIFDFKSLYIEGIAQIEPIDIEIADDFGYVVKLLGKARDDDKGFEARVHPTLVNKNSILASVNGAFNAVQVMGNFVGETLSYGAGAGSYPTSSAVLGDLIQIGRALSSSDTSSPPPLSFQIEHLRKKQILPIDELETEYYLRFTVLDKVGVLASLTKSLGENNISIRCMIQKSKEHVPGLPVAVVILTHIAREKDIRAAINEIDKMPIVTSPTRLIRIDP